MNYSQELLQKIASSLKAVGCDGKAGELYEKMGYYQTTGFYHVIFMSRHAPTCNGLV